MAALDRITCAAIAVMELVIGQVGFEMDVSWHDLVLQQYTATPYDETYPGARAHTGRPRIIPNQQFFGEKNTAGPSWE